MISAATKAVPDLTANQAVAADKSPHDNKQFDLSKLNAYFQSFDNLVFGVANALGVNTILSQVEGAVPALRSVHDVAADIAKIDAPVANATSGVFGDIAKDLETLSNQVANLTGQVNANTSQLNGGPSPAGGEGA